MILEYIICNKNIYVCIYIYTYVYIYKKNYIKEELSSVFSNKIEQKGTLPNLFYEINISLIPKLYTAR